jgi:hypothetical protein
VFFTLLRCLDILKIYTQVIFLKSVCKLALSPRSAQVYVVNFLYKCHDVDKVMQAYHVMKR